MLSREVFGEMLCESSCHLENLVVYRDIFMVNAIHLPGVDDSRTVNLQKFVWWQLTDEVFQVFLVIY